MDGAADDLDNPAEQVDPPVDRLETVSVDGRVWVDVDGLVRSLRARAAALSLAGEAESSRSRAAVLHGRAVELEGRADALALALLADLVTPHPQG